MNPSRCEVDVLPPVPTAVSVTELVSGLTLRTPRYGVLPGHVTSAW